MNNVKLEGLDGGLTVAHGSTGPQKTGEGKIHKLTGLGRGGQVSSAPSATTYSYRMATSGSTCAALTAGTDEATAAVANRLARAAIQTLALSGLTP